MNLDDFRSAVFREFGSHLEHATPANVRDFLDRLQSDEAPRPADRRIVLDEPAETFEEIIRDFFAGVLELPTEEAFIQLWRVAIELSFAAIENHYSTLFGTLFGKE